MARNRALVYTNCKEGRDAEFNKWYDEVHVREVIEFSKITGCQRFQLAETQQVDGIEYRYLALYEYDCATEEMLDSIMKASDRFDMGDSLDNAQMVLYESLGPRVGSA